MSAYLSESWLGGTHVYHCSLCGDTDKACKHHDLTPAAWPDRRTAVSRIMRDQLHDFKALLRESHHLHEMAILTFDTYTESGKEIFAQTAAHLENIKAALGML